MNPDEGMPPKIYARKTFSTSETQSRRLVKHNYSKKATPGFGDRVWWWYLSGQNFYLPVFFRPDLVQRYFGWKRRRETLTYKIQRRISGIVTRKKSPNEWPLPGAKLIHFLVRAFPFAPAKLPLSQLMLGSAAQLCYEAVTLRGEEASTPDHAGTRETGNSRRTKELVTSINGHFFRVNPAQRSRKVKLFVV